MDFEQEPLHDESDAPLAPKQERDEYQPASTPGKTLGLFFAIVLIAALCLGVGYHLGNRSAASPASTPASTESAPLSNAPKPSAVIAANSQPAPTDANAAQAPATASPADSGSAPTAPAAPSPSAQTSQAAPPAQSSSALSAVAKPAPELSPAIAPGHEFSVQVAAVTNEEDADALVNALRSKNYPVYVVSDQPGDKFFHVQVGPFASLADAQAMRTRLAGDGYNPILKK